MYVCGPTVYDDPHIGHGRFTLVWDVIRRYLEWRGLRVRFVSNVTDIEDKIIARAEAEGRPEGEVTAQYEAVWYDDMDRLGVRRPDLDPHATAYVGQMVDLVERLVAAGAAYETGDGVYMAVDAVPGYGVLARQSLDGLKAGARVEGGRGEALAGGLRAVEEGQAGRAHLALAVGAGPTGLAHRVRGDVARPAGRRLRPARRGHRPGLPPTTRTNGPRPWPSATSSPATGCTAAT